jgi:hypothetical protein
MLNEAVKGNEMQAKIVYADGNWIGMYMGKKVVKSYDQTRVVKMMAKAGHKVTVPASEDVTAPQDGEDTKWPINQRFEFVTQLVNMIAQGNATSVLITGPGGLGKTHTVKEALAANGLEDVSSFESDAPSKAYKMIKGYSTAKGLYRELYMNRDSVLVFDDCDDVLKDATALNLLKGALDSYDKRVISWNADMKDDDLPRSFVFQGRIIFISNMRREQVANALLTRAYCIDLKMTSDQKVERMQHMTSSATFMPQYSQKHKDDAMALIRSVQGEVKELSLRTLQAVTKLRAAGGNWKAIAQYVLTN